MRAQAAQVQLQAAQRGQRGRVAAQARAHRRTHLGQQALREPRRGRQRAWRRRRRGVAERRGQARRRAQRQAALGGRLRRAHGAVQQQHCIVRGLLLRRVLAVRIAAQWQRRDL